MDASEKTEKTGKIPPLGLPLGEWDSGIGSEWDDFIRSEREKNYSPEDFRKVRASTPDVPTEVWTAIGGVAA